MSKTKQRNQKKNRPGRAVTASKGASRLAQKRAAVILEVLAGRLLPSDAAAAMGVSTPRYYVLESYAMAGLVKACEPRTVGHKRTPERQLALLKQSYDKLEQECARYKALVRAMHRSVGLAAGKTDSKPPKKGGRRVKPTVRALRHARALKAAAGGDSSGEKPAAELKPGPKSTNTEVPKTAPGR